SRVWNVIPSSNLPHQSVRLNPKTQVVIDLPDSLRNELDEAHVCVAKLRESLVVYGSVYVDGSECRGVWVMEHDSSFRKLFTIGARDDGMAILARGNAPISCLSLRGC
nr:hypothetical protein [Tanacetum cinerariifolium]